MESSLPSGASIVLNHIHYVRHWSSSLGPSPIKEGPPKKKHKNQRNSSRHARDIESPVSSHPKKTKIVHFQNQGEAVYKLCIRIFYKHPYTLQRVRTVVVYHQKRPKMAHMIMVRCSTQMIPRYHRAYVFILHVLPYRIFTLSLTSSLRYVWRVTKT